MGPTDPAKTKRPVVDVAGNLLTSRAAPPDCTPRWEDANIEDTEFRWKTVRPRGLLARFRYGRRRRSPEVPDLPGLWLTPRRFYQLARECVVEHDDGWATETCDPGHRFVAWELAVRYEAAARSVKLHYTQICDLATPDECDERIARIADHLDEMRRLSEIETAVRPMLGDDPKILKMMSYCPRPLYAEPPADPRLKEFSLEHLGDLLPSLDRVIALQASGAPFQPEALTLLIEADERIPGVGTPHSVFLDDRRYVYPFDAEFESIIRPLRYSLAQIGSAYAQSTSARFAVQTAASHLEGCLKALCGGRHRRKPLGALLRTREATSLLDGDLRDAMISFTDQGANVAKHDFSNADGPIPLFAFADAVYAHYLARRFGAAVLDACGQLDPMIDAVNNAAERKSFFRGAALSIPPPDQPTADQCP